MYCQFFVDKKGYRMNMDMFRMFCEDCDFNPEDIEQQANIYGFNFVPIFGMALIDFVGFEYPYEVYDVMK